MTREQKRILLGVGGPVLTAALVFGPVALLWKNAPDPMAIGWNAAGGPTEPLTLRRFVAVHAILVGLCATGFLVGALRSFPRPITNGMIAAFAGAATPVLASNSISTMLANNIQRSWTEVDAPSLAWIAISLLGALLGLAAVGLLASDLFLTAESEPTTERSSGFGPSHARTSAWHSSASAPWPVVVPMVSGAIAIALIGAAVPLGATLMIAVGLAALIVCIGTLTLSHI